MFNILRLVLSFVFITAIIFSVTTIIISHIIQIQERKLSINYVCFSTPIIHEVKSSLFRLYVLLICVISIFISAWVLVLSYVPLYIEILFVYLFILGGGTRYWIIEIYLYSNDVRLLIFFFTIESSYRFCNVPLFL